MNVAVPRFSEDIIYHICCCRNTRRCNIFAYNGLPWGGLLHCDLHF